MSGQSNPGRIAESGSGGTKPRASEVIFDALRMEITFGLLKPRERLVEFDLCQRFGTSNHNIRQAFELLDRVGLVDRRANRGVEVKALNARELTDLCEVREMLQREGARKIDLSRAEELAAKLAKINSVYAAALDAGSFQDAVRANDAFHMTTYDYCTNTDLADLQRTYWLKASAVVSHALSDRALSRGSCQDHDAIIAAIRNRDVEQLVRISVAHIQPAAEVYRKLYQLP